MINEELIFSKLIDLNIDYKVLGDVINITGFGSIKKIENNKLYYSVGDVPESINNSMVIVNDEHNKNSKKIIVILFWKSRNLHFTN